jgi:hypothetical protein
MLAVSAVPLTVKDLATDAPEFASALKPVRVAGVTVIAALAVPKAHTSPTHSIVIFSQCGLFVFCKFVFIIF